MARAFEAPVVTSPGGASVSAFVVEADGVVDVDKVWTTILEHWGPPPAIPVTDAEREAEREIARAETANSALRQLSPAAGERPGRNPDARRRRAADSNDSSHVARVAKRVNDARRDLLRDARAIDRTRDDVFAKSVRRPVGRPCPAKCPTFRDLDYVPHAFLAAKSQTIQQRNARLILIPAIYRLCFSENATRETNSCKSVYLAFHQLRAQSYPRWRTPRRNLPVAVRFGNAP